uniref:Si:dkey-106n21.1 n=1 Tax=Cyprinus carpio TaxID=7962 RepID=A0A8C1YVY9_CYPCA
NSLEEDLDSRPKGYLFYSINDHPPWYLCILLGFQHYILAFGGILAIPLILAEPLKSQLISTIFVSGMSTLLQTTLGTRYWDKHSSECELYTLPEEKIQGAILVASVLQLVLGLSCLVGLVLRFIRPLGIAPTINLTGLSLFIQAVQKSGAHWGIAALTVCVILLFSQYLSKVNLPLIANKDKKWKVFQYPLFKLFSALFGMCGAWLVCFLLTYFNALPSSLNEYGFMARTDINLDAVKSAELLTLAFLGHGNGTTSYSQNIATLGIARVGSRLVFQTAGLLMIILGLFGKLSAVFITIPDPVIGGMFLVMFGMVAAVGISNLQYVDLNSSRNLLILGFSTFSGLVLPTWFHSNPGMINTGIKELDQLIMILFTTHMFTDGFFGFVLDNTIPGKSYKRMTVGHVNLQGHPGVYGTLDHKTSLKSLGYICSNSQKYIVWVKIIDFSLMPKIIRILSKDHVP